MRNLKQILHILSILAKSVSNVPDTLEQLWCVQVYAQHSEAAVSHLRDRNGEHEVDLIVSKADASFDAVEVQLAGTVDDRDVRQLKWLRDRMGDQMRDAIVVNTGPMAYRRPDGIAVVPLAMLGPREPSVSDLSRLLGLLICRIPLPTLPAEQCSTIPGGRHHSTATTVS